MAVRRALRGDNVIYRNAVGDSMAVIVTAGQGIGVTDLAGVGSEDGANSLTAGDFEYQVTYVKDGLESEVSNTAEVTLVGAEDTITLTWTAVAGATEYKVYGRDVGDFLLVIDGLTDPTYVDDGSETPSGAAPATDYNISFRTPYAGHAEITGALPGLGAEQYQRIY